MNRDVLEDWFQNALQKNLLQGKNILIVMDIAKYHSREWLQLDSNPQPLSLKTNTQPFSQAGQIIELSCEYYLYSAFDCMFLSWHVRISE